VKTGKYIVIEGNDGTGKSTQVEKIRELLENEGIESIEFHEPAGSPMADAIRTILKDGSLERSGETNLLLFTAARHEIWRRAQQELALGKWVVAARNYYSTVAYQGYGEGLSLDLIAETMRTFTGERYLNPDFAAILHIDRSVRESRIANRGELEKPDAFESRNIDFQTKVTNGYLEIAKDKGLPVVDASQSVEDVTRELWTRIQPLLL
jgi:dTMP kinase